jgi:hypothetical protein
MASAFTSPEGEASSTSSKVDYFRREIQNLVSQGIEVPEFELTRQCALANEKKQSQADFAKTIQGMANAYPPIQRVYVVGADRKEKRFFPVENEHEFDAANVRQILEKYLEPLPNFEALVLETDGGTRFAAIILAAEQPRPIVAKVQAGDDKTQFLQRGDIWIKKNTGLVRANRDDLEEIYRTRNEAEVERRAERRFAEMRNVFEASFRLQLSPERKIPSGDLVFGPEAEYAAYIESLLANQDGLRFAMLITVLRDFLVERWHSIDAYDPEAPVKTSAFESKVSDHLQNTFRPALRRLVYAGLLLIKFQIGVDLFKSAADLLVEVFGNCNRLAALPPPASNARTNRATVALEPLVAGRVLAAYALRMERYHYLPRLLRQVVIPVCTNLTRKREPFLFWPVRMNVPGNDRIAYTWESAVRPNWLEFFGNEGSYLGAASHLEFLLRMNSYLATQRPEAARWVTKYRPDVEFGYWYTSDLWRYSLEPIVPLAEKIYENLPIGPDAAFLVDLSVEQGVFQKAFRPSEHSATGDEQRIFISYLEKLASWISEAAFSSGRVPYQTDWGPVLGPLIRQETAEAT